MGRELVILWAGRHQRDRWEELCSGYRRRIAHSVPVREQAIKVSLSGSAQQRLAAEGEALLEALPARSWVLALHRKGEQLTSEELARRLGKLRRDWPHSLVFLIGSDLGLHPRVLERARQRLSLGPLTLPHELARLVLYEQLYRALAIESGINYHR